MVEFPSFLLTLPRNPIFAIGLPLALGTLSGSVTANVVRGPWYQESRATLGHFCLTMFLI